MGRGRIRLTFIEMPSTSSISSRDSNPGNSRKWRLTVYGIFSGLLCCLLMDDIGLLWLMPALRDWIWTAPTAIVVGAMWGATKGRHVLHAVTALMLLLWLVVGYTPLAGYLIRPLPLMMQPAKADAVVVLSSNIYEDGGFTAAGLSRLVHGLELIQQRYASQLVVTELPAPYNVNAAANERQANRLGIHCRIDAVGPVRDTHDEAVLIADLARRQGWRRVLLVTSPTHSRRATLLFQRAGFEVISSPCQETRFSVGNPSGPADRRWAFTAYLHEKIGLWVYHRRGWI